MRALIVAVMLIVACTPRPVSPPPDVVDAGPVVVTPCAAACVVLRAKDCPEGLPTDAGESCEALCERVQGEGHPLPVACVASKSSVDGIRACGVRCVP